MKFLLSIIVLSFLFATNVRAQVLFQSRIASGAAGGGSPSITGAKCTIAQTEDFGFVSVGTSFLGSGSTDIILTKMDAFGNVEFSKTYGGAADNEYGYGVTQTSDKGFVIVGRSYSFGAGWYDAYIIKTDQFGSTQWVRTLGGNQNDLFRSVIETSDGHLMMVGETSNFGAGGLDFYLAKYDMSGNVLWSKTYGHIGTEYGYSVQESDNGGFILCGYTGSFGVDFWDMYLVKVDDTGNLEWSKTYGAIGGSSDERAFKAVVTPDGGYAAVGYSSNLGTAGSWDIYLVKLDSAGNEQWSKTYGSTGIEIGNDLLVDKSGNFVIVGQGSFTSGNFIMKTDPTGNILFSKEFTGPSYGHAFSVAETGKGYVMMGRSASEFYYVKTDTLGVSGCQETAVGISMNIPSTHTTVVGTIDSVGGIAQVSSTQELLQSLVDTVYCVSGCVNPVPGFSWTDGPLTSTFTNNSQSYGPATYLWDFGDGNADTSSNPVHVYTNPGTYYVCLTVTDSLCTAETFCDSVEVFTCPLPSSGFGYSTNYLNTNFTNTSSSGTYSWDFGDGNTDTTTNPGHTYTTSGTYWVCLTTTDMCGNTTYCDSVTVTACSPQPVSLFTFSLNSFTVTLSNTSTTGQYQWDFGDGNTDTTANPVHTYQSSGDYTICLTTQDTCGSNTYCDTVSISFSSLTEHKTSAIKLYPNPTKDILYVDTQYPVKNISVANSLGQHIKIEYSNNRIDVSTLPKGIYTLIIHINDTLQTLSFIKN